MRTSRFVNGLVAVVLGIVGSVVLGVSPAHAYPTDPFQVKGVARGSGYEGEAEGIVTWYNRSVGVQGYVLDGGDRYSTVIFRFYIGPFNDDEDHFWHVETRTVTDGTRSYNFVVEGPAGGITWVKILICHGTRSLDCGGSYVVVR